MDEPRPKRFLAATTLPASEGPRSRREYASGDTIDGRYRLIRKLEEGGMGEVWVAQNLALDVQVALKLVLSDRGSELADERLIREARAAARLDHPAIVRVFDVGRAASGEPYLVMELLEGEALADVLARDGRMDPVAAVRALLPIASALAAMHERGMVHRDVKPENIFFARDDAGRTQPKLIDFGVAKLDERSGLRRLTRRGALVGTPGYMAPEQVQGSTDARADVWALAVVLYEALAGQAPFVGDTYPLLIAAVLACAPAPLSEHGVTDAQLAAIVGRGLRPIGERWPSVRALGEALAAWLWSRGETEDVTGHSLRAAWLGDAEVRRLAAVANPRHVATQRMPAPVLALPRGTPTRVPAPAAAAPPPAAAIPAPPAGPASDASTPPLPLPDSVPLRRSSRIPVAIVGMGVLVAAIIVAVAALTRPPAVDPATASLSTAPAAAAPSASSPAVPPEAPAPSAAALPPATASAAPPRKPPPRWLRDAGPPRDGDLKNPFH